MGSAMLSGWLNSDFLSHVHVLDPVPKKNPDPRVTFTDNIYDFEPHIKDMDCIVLAVKPQTLSDLCAQLAGFVSHDLPIISIAAGYSLDSFHRHFHERQPLVRCMPNTPGAIGKGITGVLRTHLLTKAHQAMVNTLLSSLGDVVWVDDEKLMDNITAVSGSGPAYVFYMIEALAEAGRKSGLPDDIARQLARKTVIGAAALADNTPDTDASTLRQNVTSPGGTTEAALEELMNGTFQDVMNKAVEAAVKRGKELSK